VSDEIGSMLFLKTVGPTPLLGARAQSTLTLKQPSQPSMIVFKEGNHFRRANWYGQSRPTGGT